MSEQTPETKVIRTAEEAKENRRLKDRHQWMLILAAFWIFFVLYAGRHWGWFRFSRQPDPEYRVPAGNP